MLDDETYAIRPDMNTHFSEYLVDHFYAKWKATIVANTRGTAGRRRKGQQVGFRGEKRELVQTRYLRGAKYIVRVVRKPT